ncbi:pilus assembly protein PilY [Psychrobacter sp. APC 3426]|uniref:pilus assembly protein PilY n=1 Tax=Psychrobacter sp. APC 3426 TaxID=3035177 RepID=UPI0025B5E113|nr:pilus assembly protein PilY [Psychrobacter sp. APC 3426]MDN3397967.1 pilus assembly protein PilY [Psychrobacter sp. APC 3426]
MKRLNNVSPARDSKVLPLKYLVVVMASTIVLPVAHADVAGKKIGDLEIYKAAEGGKTTITMMLDTSGSMTLNQVNSAVTCDLPSGTSYTKGSEDSNTTPVYTKDFCAVGARYYYRLSPEGQWYRCGPRDGSGNSSYNFSICDTKITNPSLGSEYNYVTSGSDNRYFYTSTKYYDRLTRLKDAIFTLLDSSLLDKNKVSIGIGQYSSQSGSDNVVRTSSDGTARDADGSTGKIVVSAALVDATQIAKIKKAVADARGGNGTPTANAYAEVGAYMLGTNPSASSYSGYDKSVADSKSGGRYNSPLSSPSSCDGRGIYFLTDGNPNSSPNPNYVMQLALGANSFSIPSVTLPSGSENNNAMPQVGAFAKALRNPAINPLGTDREIYTAVVGFGSVFNVNASDIVNLPYTNPKTGITANRDFYNCASITDLDARNACNWGEKAHPDLPGVGGYGEGGFYSAQSTEDIVKSITSFVSGLNQNIPSTPSGTIIIPDDPYRADSQLAVAYYPTLQADVKGNAVIWDGNMKKYLLNEGTLYGSNNNKLFKNVAGELEPTTPDLWSDKDYGGANNEVKSGGFYALLNTPKTGVTSTRTLYVEDLDGTTPVLRRFGVNALGKVVVDNAALTTTSFSDTATFDEETLRRLLSFLGFNNLPSTATAVKDMELTVANATEEIRVVGATIHSTPAAVSYSATLDDDGKVTAVRDDYVLFGSSEGGLHLVDADNYSAGGDGGKEDFVVIPREMLRDKSKSLALVDDSNKAEIGSPNFGIDAPWLVSANYKYDLTNNTVNIATDGNKGLYAYGGLRMGGEAFYGLNLTNRTSPSMMFTITPTSTGFSRMGQIWSKPTKAKIKRSSTDTGTDVLVFGGGYDMCYEYEKFQVGVTDTSLGTCSGKTNVKGNAVYIVNAITGDLIWSASSNGSPSTTVSTMTNSVVAGITTLDRDNDGFMDHIYFADLGGQLFRADFTNAGFQTQPAIGSTPTGTPTTTTAFANTRVTRILSGAYSGTDTKFNHRFYERPVVSFHRNSQTNSLFALVNVISGDRSSPLSKIRDLSKSDRLYGIMDIDVSKPDNLLYASNFTTTAAADGGQTILDLTANNTPTSNLVELPGAIGTLTAGGYTLAQKNVVSDQMRAGTKQGWYYPLTRFDGYGNVLYTKGIGKSQVIDNFLYTTTYNPDMSYGSTNSCSAKIVGGSERQLYCLPYGICTDSKSKNGTGGFVRAGKGIQELTLGPRSSTLSNQRLLIGTRTLAERATDRVDFGTDTGKDAYTPINEAQGLGSADQILGSGSAPELIFNERFSLQPKVWYEVD